MTFERARLCLAILAVVLMCASACADLAGI